MTQLIPENVSIPENDTVFPNVLPAPTPAADTVRQELRPYQRHAVDTLIRLAPKQQFLLLQAATGAGKTIMAAALMRHYSLRWHFRCLFLAHKAILVRQALARMQTTFADADVDVDCLCASVEKPGQAGGHIIVASPQTLVHRLENLPRVDVIIIDECHRVPPKGSASLYADIIDTVTRKRPNARVIGVTATPWRLGQGPIYGATANAWWGNLDVRVSIRELQDQGWLCPLIARVCRPARELLDVPVGSSGDYREDELEQTLLRPLHLGSAVQAVRTEAAGRQHIVVFCVSIAHARTLADRFQEAGFTAAAVDSRAGDEANAQALAAFSAGRIRILCTVAMLTEGWDCPQTDCLVMCRPTLSATLYVQMTGRGLRIASGKRDCLLLDLSGNVMRHGSPNAPCERAAAHAFDNMTGMSGSVARDDKNPRFCPFCDAILPQEVELSCPDCQASFYDVNEEGRIFRNVNLDRLERLTTRGERVRQEREKKLAEWRASEKARKEQEKLERTRLRSELVNQGRPLLVHILEHGAPEVHHVRSGPAAGACVLKMRLLLGLPDGRSLVTQVILDPEARMGRRSKHYFWVRQDTRDFWQCCGQGLFPASMEALRQRWHTVHLPEKVTMKQTLSGFVRILWKEATKTTPAMARPHAKKI